MFFLFSVIELILLGTGISMFTHHKLAIGAVLVGIAVLMFLSTSARYSRRSRWGGPGRGGPACGGLDCLALECGFLEGLECAECADCGAMDCDCLGS